MQTVHHLWSMVEWLLDTLLLATCDGQKNCLPPMENIKQLLNALLLGDLDLFMYIRPSPVVVPSVKNHGFTVLKNLMLWQAFKWSLNLWQLGPSPLDPRGYRMISTTATRCPLAGPHAPHNWRKEKEKQRTVCHRRLGVMLTLISLLIRLSLIGQRVAPDWTSRNISGNPFQISPNLLSPRKAVPKQEVHAKKSGVAYVLFYSH